MTTQREEAYAAQAKRIEKLQEENPGVDLKGDSGWWKESIDFGFNVKEELDEPTNAKINELMAKLLSQDMSQEAKEQTMKEARDCLKDHPDLVKQFDGIFGNISPEFWKTVDSMKKQLNQDAAAK